MEKLHDDDGDVNASLINNYYHCMLAGKANRSVDRFNVTYYAHSMFLQGENPAVRGKSKFVWWSPFFLHPPTAARLINMSKNEQGCW